MILHQITEPRVRRWRAGLLDDGLSEVTVAKAYRLIKAIMNTAVDDGLIRRKPCRIKGAGPEKSPERPILNIGQVFDLATAVIPRYRMLVLLAVFGNLQWGELAALRRCDLDVASGTVRVELAVVELMDGSLVTGPPKSEAGRRTLALPEFLVPDLEAHLEQFTAEGRESLVFTGPKNAPLRRSNFSDARRRATVVADLDGVHFHDLRHTGNHISGTTGATSES